MKNIFIAVLLTILAMTAFTQSPAPTRYGLELPAGFIMPYAGSSCPAGFFETDGTTKSRTQFARLYAAIGVAHGNGDGTSTYHLPDYRGRFLRMIDRTAGVDVDKAARTAMNAGGAVGNNVGSIQSDINKLHGHPYRTGVLGSSTDGAGGLAIEASNNADHPEYTGTLDTDRSHQITGSGGSESRPKNAYVLYCIKY